MFSETDVRKFTDSIKRIFDRIGKVEDRVTNLEISDSQNFLIVRDGITAPSASTGFATIYVDTADGDLKIIFGDGTIKTIVVDT